MHGKKVSNSWKKNTLCCFSCHLCYLQQDCCLLKLKEVQDCIMGKHQKRLRYPISQKSRQDTFVLPSSQEKLPIFEQVGSRYILYCIATLGLKLLTVENMYQVFTLLTYIHTIFLRLRWFQFSTTKRNQIFLILFSNFCNDWIFF